MPTRLPAVITLTRRLEVRPLVMGDYRAWLEAYTTMDSPQSVYDESHYPEKNLNYDFFRGWIKRNRLLGENDKAYIFGVFEKKSGQLVGTTNLIVAFRIDLQTAFIGYEVFNRYWRRGYGRESVRATLDCGFKHLHLHRIEAGIEPGNKPSIALAKSLGMRREGLQKRYCYSNNKWEDLISFALTADEMGYAVKPPEVRAKFCLENL